MPPVLNITLIPLTDVTDMNILIGADPELFLKKDGEIVSAYGVIPGTKKQPYRVDEGAVQVDGMALEFNIDPCSTADEFVRRIAKVKSILGEMAGGEMLAIPVAEFDEEYIKAQPEEAKELGCDPDYNAYTGVQNTIPDATFNFRTGSGHVHIGWTEGEDPMHPDHFEACQMLTKQLDCCLGIASLLWDKDKRRRNLYGKAGAFRPKPYGVEYRVLSNAWLNDDKLAHWIFNTANKAFNDLVEGKQYWKSDYVHNPLEVLRGRYGNLSENYIKEALRCFDISMPVFNFKPITYSDEVFVSNICDGRDNNGDKIYKIDFTYKGKDYSKTISYTQLHKFYNETGLNDYREYMKRLVNLEAKKAAQEKVNAYLANTSPWSLRA